MFIEFLLRFIPPDSRHWENKTAQQLAVSGNKRQDVATEMERFLPNPEKLIRKDNQESQPTHGRRLHMQLRLFHFLQENILSEENKAGGLHAV